MHHREPSMTIVNHDWSLWTNPHHYESFLTVICFHSMYKICMWMWTFLLVHSCHMLSPYTDEVFELFMVIVGFGKHPSLWTTIGQYQLALTTINRQPTIVNPSFMAHLTNKSPSIPPDSERSRDGAAPLLALKGAMGCRNSTTATSPSLAWMTVVNGC